MDRLIPIAIVYSTEQLMGRKLTDLLAFLVAFLGQLVSLDRH